MADELRPLVDTCNNWSPFSFLDDGNIVRYSLAHSCELKAMICEMLDWDPARRAPCPSGLTPLSGRLVAQGVTTVESRVEPVVPPPKATVALSEEPVVPPPKDTATTQMQGGVVRPQEDQEEEGGPKKKRIKIKSNTPGLELNFSPVSRLVG